MESVPPETFNIPANFKITSLGLAKPVNSPRNLTPIMRGYFNSQGKLTIASTASAPPTPTASIPSPPALTVWLSVPIIIPPGKA